MSISEKLITIAENEQRVYEKGKQAEYDRFWDIFQTNGTRLSYYNAFYGSGWTDESFKPKYELRPTNAYAMFANSKIRDLVVITEQCGIVLDFSNCTNLSTTFAHCQITKIGVVDTRGESTLPQTFYNSQQLQSIEKVILKDDGSQTFTTPFRWNYALEEIRFEGVIGDTISFSDATKLSKASMENTISHLSNTASGKTLTLSKTAVNNAFTGGSTGTEWLTLVATKPNWTISLST